MSYQAVIRDAGSNLVNNQPIGIKVSILQGTDKGNTVFAEVFNPNPETNANGLLTIEIGGGDPVSGNFSDIDWSKGPYFIKTEVDPSGGIAYSIEGISQLLSVPFALHAKTVEVDKVDDADNDPFNEIQSLSINGSQLSLSNGGGTITIPLPTGEATPNGPAGGDLAGNYPNPVIGDGKITSLKIAGNAVIEDKIASGAVTGTKIAQAGASAGQVLKWNGTTWAPGADEAGGFSLPYNGNVTSSGNAITIVNEGTGGGISASVSTGVGLYGRTNSASGLGYGVFGSSGSSDGRGVYGEASSATGSSYGLYGRSASNAGYGVFGWATSTSGANYGVSGLSNSSAGIGVYGEASSTTGTNYGVFARTRSTQGRGVYGIAESLTGISYSVFGENKSSAGTGVYGLASNNTGANYGVRGISGSSSGYGVSGEANATSGTTYGVAGTTRSSVGYGVFGRASSTTGVNYGVYGESESIQARAVYGIAKNKIGKTFGVFGRSQSPEGGVGVAGINSTIPTNTLIGAPRPIGVYGEVSYEYGYSGYFNGGFVVIAGKLGIGDSFPYHKLHINGNASKTEGGSSWVEWSDARLKTVTGDYSKGLEEIAALRPIVYRYNENNPRNLPSDKEQVGFIAQEIQEIFPEAVAEDQDGYLTFSLHPVNIALVNAIKELKEENDRLKSENIDFQARLERLERIMSLTGELK
ncbi:MAG: tail fiber domain-containing protein [Bacteroidales bacterium]|nr:tail fiber domain-containing protein [Bacteroidales bacterium]